MSAVKQAAALAQLPVAVCITLMEFLQQSPALDLALALPRERWADAVSQPPVARKL